MYSHLLKKQKTIDSPKAPHDIESIGSLVSFEPREGSSLQSAFSLSHLQ